MSQIACPPHSLQQSAGLRYAASAHALPSGEDTRVCAESPARACCRSASTSPTAARHFSACWQSLFGSYVQSALCAETVDAARREGRARRARRRQIRRPRRRRAARRPGRPELWRRQGVWRPGRARGRWLPGRWRPGPRQILSSKTAIGDCTPLHHASDLMLCTSSCYQQMSGGAVYSRSPKTVPS